MESHSLNFSLFSLSILFLTLFICSPTATSQDGICAFIYCGQGTCKTSNTSIFGFVCECDPGWKQIQIGLVIFPACLIPNCTVYTGCGNGSPPPPPPPPPPPLFPLPPLNLTDPCNLVWCADGTCTANGTGHICQCNPGSANLANNTELPCFQDCYLGADCNELGLLPPAPPSPNSGSNNGSQSPPPPTNTGSNNGSQTPPPLPALSKAPTSWRRLGVLTVIVLAATYIRLI